MDGHEGQAEAFVTRKMYVYIYIYIYIWVSYNISLT